MIAWQLHIVNRCHDFNKISAWHGTDSASPDSSLTTRGADAGARSVSSTHGTHVTHRFRSSSPKELTSAKCVGPAPLLCAVVFPYDAYSRVDVMGRAADME